MVKAKTSTNGQPRLLAPGARAASFAAAAALASAGLLFAACASKSPQPTDTPDNGTDTAGETAMSGVNATVIVNKCPDAAHIKVRTAQDAIQKLVGPCAKVPGGQAHFSATLQPGGTIVLAAPDGNTAEGVVPTCVLKNRLTHKVPLKSPCTLDVQLDERTVPAATDDAGAPDAN